jgi:hypothetical protein
MTDRPAGKLSKRIPARTKTLEFLWITPAFMKMCEEYRAVRPKDRPMDSCFWCKHKFENGEQMGLAARYKKGNVVLCVTCADEALSRGLDQ